MKRQLSDIAVLEVASGIAPAYCGKVFADLGARVTKLETPSGDHLRMVQHQAGEAGVLGGPLFLHLNTNKLSCVVDPEAAASAEQILDLVAASDLIIDSHPSGGLSGWGISSDTLEQLTQLVIIRLSGFGATGPYSSYEYDDVVAQAASGTLLAQVGHDEPLKMPGHAGLYYFGQVAALGGLAGVMQSKQTGQGRIIDVSALEALASMPSRISQQLAFQYSGRQELLRRATGSGTTLLPTGVYPCSDGYVAMRSTPQQVNQMLSALGDEELTASLNAPGAIGRPETRDTIDTVLYPWLLNRSRAAVTSEAQTNGWPVTSVNSPGEVLSADHLHQRNFWAHVDIPDVGPMDLPGPPWSSSEGGWSLRGLPPRLGEHTISTLCSLAPRSNTIKSLPPRPTPTDADSLPLAGIRVVDLTAVWAGPFVTMLLADLGAEVIRVENPWIFPPSTKGYSPRPAAMSPGLGALESAYAPCPPGEIDRPYNRHAMNNALCRNKLSCTIDLRRPEGRDLLLRLVDQSDVVVENFKASSLTKMGIHASELMGRHPGLIVLRLPPTGLTGDWSSFLGFGMQFDGLAGFLWLCGHRGSDLTTSPATAFMDATTGPAGAFAVLSALHYRRATGRGQVLELAQLENLIQHLGDVFVERQLTGLEPQRAGNRHPWRAPQGIYRCLENRWIAISVGDDLQWRHLAQVIGPLDKDLTKRFSSAEARLLHHDELDALLSKWAASVSAFDVFHRLQNLGVPAAPVMSDEDLWSDPNLRAKEWFQPLPSRDTGVHWHSGHLFAGLPQVWRRGAPGLGQDNEYVFKEILGLPEQEFESLRRSQILADDYLDPNGQPC